MPDAKIREAISRYKTLIHELQAELSHRSFESVRFSVVDKYTINKCKMENSRVRDTKVARILRTITKFKHADKERLIKALRKE